MRFIRMMTILVCAFPVITFASPGQYEKLRLFLHKEGITKCDSYLYKYYSDINAKFVMLQSIKSLDGRYATASLDQITDIKGSDISFRKHVVINQLDDICSFTFESSHVYNVPCQKVFKLPFYEKEKKELGWKEMKTGSASHLQGFYGEGKDGSTYRRFYSDIWSNHGLTNDGFQQCLVQTFNIFTNKY